MLERLEREEEFDSFLSRHSKQVRLVEFSAEWCSPCRELKENLSKLDQEILGIAILEVDVEKFSYLAQRPEFQVSAVPTLLLFPPSSAAVEKKVGLQSLSQLKEWVEKAR